MPRLFARALVQRAETWGVGSSTVALIASPLKSCQERAGWSLSPFQGRSRCHGASSDERSKPAENWAGGSQGVGAGCLPNAPSSLVFWTHCPSWYSCHSCAFASASSPRGLAPPFPCRFELPVQVGQPVVLALAHQRDHGVGDLLEHHHTSPYALLDGSALGQPLRRWCAAVLERFRLPFALGLAKLTLVLAILVAETCAERLERLQLGNDLSADPQLL